MFQPSDGSPMFDLCSGFLVSPTVFVTAGHCAMEALEIQAQLGGSIGAAFEPAFDSDRSVFRAAASTTVHPDFVDNPVSYQSPDVAVLVLQRSVTGADPMALPAAGAADRLAHGTQLTTVGYGFTQDCGTNLGGCQWAYDPARRYASETLTSVSQWFITVSQNPNGQGVGGVCRGDSGGPHLLPGTTTAVAITTAIASRQCWSTSRDTRLDTTSALQFVRSFAPSA